LKGKGSEESLSVLAEILEAIRERLDEIKALQATSITSIKEFREEMSTFVGLKELKNILANIANSLSIVNEFKEYIEKIESRYDTLTEEIKSLRKDIEDVKMLTSESMKKSVKLLEQAMELLNLPDMVNQIAKIVNDLTVKVAELSKPEQESTVQEKTQPTSDEV